MNYWSQKINACHLPYTFVGHFVGWSSMAVALGHSNQQRFVLMSQEIATYSRSLCVCPLCLRCQLGPRAQYSPYHCPLVFISHINQCNWKAIYTITLLQINRYDTDIFAFFEFHSYNAIINEFMRTLRVKVHYESFISTCNMNSDSQIVLYQIW